MKKLKRSAAIDARSAKIVQAVRFLCPNAKSLEFTESSAVITDTLRLSMRVQLMVALDLLSVTNQQVCFYYEILQIMYKYLQLRIILFFSFR